MTIIRNHLMITATLVVGCVVLLLLAVGQADGAPAALPSREEPP